MLFCILKEHIILYLERNSLFFFEEDNIGMMFIGGLD